MLSTDDDGGFLSRLADGMEAVQLATGADVLKEARRMLNDPMTTRAEMQYAGVRLAECLRDALRVAESRGMRLSVPDSDEDWCRTTSG